jgi:glutathione S-transferase
MQDPNANDIILWESGAIVEYIVDNYDKDNKLSFAEGPEKWYLKQYLHFQMSGQVSITPALHSHGTYICIRGQF